jgi:uncharacterized protein (TIGR03435 family)
MLRALVIASVLLGSRHAFGQSTAPRPQFDVASIKLNKSGDLRMMVRPSPGGRFTVTNVPLQFVVTMAYRIKDSQLSGTPPWFLAERYDIEAKAEGNPSFDAMLPMVQTLLEDRLQLKFHRDIKELASYSLVVVRPGKLHPAEGECGPPPIGPLPAPEPGKLPTPPCGAFFALPGHLGAQKAAISRLSDTLSLLTDRIVEDNTGLPGKYDIDLQYASDLAESAPGSPPHIPADDRPSLFTALQDQLGLKLESQKGLVEIIVIDHVERPSEN